MAAKRIATVEVWEGTRRVVTMTVRDTDGVAIPLASMTTITLTLKKSGNPINERDAQSILNANGGTYHATSGLLSIVLTPDDNIMVGAGDVERHSALVEFTYASGQKEDSFPFFVDVTKVRR